MPFLTRHQTGLTVAVTMLLAGGTYLAFAGRLSDAFERVEATTNDRYVVRHLRTIGRALLAYEREHGSLPPTILTSETGEEWHSWRTLIAGRLSRYDSVRNIDPDRPYDVEPNRSRLRSMPTLNRQIGPGLFQDGVGASGSATTFVAITGPDGRWTTADITATSELTEGERLPLVVHVPQSTHDWRLPGDPLPGGALRPGAWAFFSDGTVGRLPQSE